MLTENSRILAAYDGSELSKKALNSAIHTASQFQAELHVLLVTNVLLDISYPDIYAVQSKIREEAKSMLKDVEKELEKRLPNKHATVILEGSPASEIIRYAKEKDVELMVMGNRGNSGLKEFVLGSVSHHVVQHAECPVLVIK